MEERKEITPYRRGTLMSLANKVTKQMLSNACHLSYDEMEVVLNLIRCGINESREMNDKWKEAGKDGAGSGESRVEEGSGKDCS